MKTKIQCPNCSASINVDELLTHQLEHSIRKSVESDLQKREDSIKEKIQDFESRIEKFAKEKMELDKTIDSRSKELLEAKEKSLREKLTKEIEKESSTQINLLTEELERKSNQVKELNSTKAQIETLRRDNDELEARITFQKEQELTKKLETAIVKIKEQVTLESQLKLKEREKIIQDLSNKLDEAKRKVEQGSVQLQGEVQELELINVLQEMHPLDEITQSKKGANGADVLQLVKTETNTACGKIYYESKRTKTWSNEWIAKFKKDNRGVNADVLVLVTNTLPKEMSRYGLVDGVWICGFNEVKELSFVLRFGLMRVHAVSATQHGKETKMELLYNYLTSNEFKIAFSSILDGYKSLMDMHNTEKLRMQRIWKEREIRLQYIMTNTVDFYGSIRGIAGKAIPEMKALETSEEESE